MVKDEQVCTVLRSTVEAIAGLGGEAFFERLVLALAASMGVRYAFVGELQDDGETSEDDRLLP